MLFESDVASEQLIASLAKRIFLVDSIRNSSTSQIDHLFREQLHLLQI